MSQRKFFFAHGDAKTPVGDGDVRIGSADDNEIVIRGTQVEPLTAVARRSDDGVVLESRAKEHEAKVNGRMLSVAEVADGDAVVVGGLELTARGGGSAWRLEGAEGSFPLQVGANLVGRTPDSTVVLDHPSVSRKHALIMLLPTGGLRVRDLGSANGTQVGGRRLGQAELRHGDRVEVGDQTLIFLAVAAQPGAAKAEDAAEATPQPRAPASGSVPEATVILGADKPAAPAPAPGPAAEQPAAKKPPAPPPPPPRELVIDGETRTLEPGTLSIGRSPDCDVSLADDDQVSRRHAEIIVLPDSARLRDLGSSNGTRRNDRRIEGEVVLADGDRIAIGRSEMQYRAPRPADPMGATVLAPRGGAAAPDKTVIAPEGGPPGAGAGPPGDRTSALATLDLPADAGPDQVRRRYQELFSDYQIRLTNAPTPDLKQRYQRRLDELAGAAAILLPAASRDSADLPASQPVDAPPAAAAPPAAPEGPPAAASPPPAAPEPAAPEQAAQPPAAAEPAAGDGGLPRSTLAMAGVSLLLVLATVVFTFLYLGAARVENGLRQQLEESRRELGAMYERIPQASNAVETLQGGTAARLENHEMKICNLGSRELVVDWVHATWVGPDGRFQGYNSALFNYPTWPVAAGGTLKFNEVIGDEVLWDGRAVFFSASLRYGGEEYFRSGAVENLGIDCYNLNLDG